MADYQSVSSALGPVFALVLLGYVFRLSAFPGPAFWPLAERFTYYLLFPSLLVSKLATTNLKGLDISAAVGALLLLLLLASLAAYGLGRWLRLQNPPLTSFFQGGVRFNTYVGLAAAVELFGEVGLLWGAVFIALMIPSVNVCCIAVFSLTANSRGDGPATAVPWAGIWKLLVQNPLIVACLLGIGLNVSGLGLPWGSASVLSLLSQMALPLGLLAVGVGLDLRVVRRDSAALWLCSAFKLLLYPLAFVLIARLVGLSAQAMSVFLVFALLPTASSAYILARQLGGDAPLMAAIITLQTLLAMVTMPLMLLILT